ncbi:MAG: hypothetical protein ACRDV4_02735, partial [Acidimicrobiales bacterium]
WRSVRAVDETAACVESHVPRGRVMVDFAVAHPQPLSDFTGYAEAAGTAWALEADGWRPVLTDSVAFEFGPGYERGGNEPPVASVRLDWVTDSVLGVALGRASSKSR